MTFSSWRGIVGMINPTLRPGVTEEVIRLLPEGIGLIPLFLNIRRGTAGRVRDHDAALRKARALLAGAGCDLIHPNGAPPFMVQGRKARSQDRRGLGEEIQDADHERGAEPRARAARRSKPRPSSAPPTFPPKLNAIFAKYFTRRRLQGARHGRHRRAVRQGAGAVEPTRSTPTSSAIF